MRGFKASLPMVLLLTWLCPALSAATDSVVSAVLDNGTRLYLSDGSIFFVDPSLGADTKLSVGDAVSYEEHGGCITKDVWTITKSAQHLCVQRSKEKLISIEAVQTETAKAIVTENSAFAFPIGKAAVSTGSSVQVETIKIVAEDIMLNGQKVRLRCERCHALNPGEYQARLQGDKLWIVSYGMEWDKHAEKLTQRTYEERWIILGPWQ